MPRIDPTGERIFADSPTAGPRHFREYPGGMLPWENTQVIVTPSRTIAPVGSEVVLLAGVRGQDQFLRTNERVEWTVSSGSVGHFLDYDKGTWVDLMLGDFTWPRKLSGAMAVGSTSRRYMRLSRGTPATSDDVCVLRGQTWVTVTSPIEGTTQVTAYAPSVYGWDGRKQTATIHWVDAQWTFPPPAINPAGAKHTFTTTVLRHTDRCPCVGWHVRYEIAGGPAAAFAPDGSASVEVTTNAAGQASVEIHQPQPASGTNRINIQVIRPSALPGSGGKRLVVGRGGTMATWTTPELSLRKTGPAAVGVGDAVTYRIDVSNPGDLPADDVVVTDELPVGLEYSSSNPPAERIGERLRWRIGRLGPHQTSSMTVQLRSSQLGSMTSCAEATAAGGLKSRDCVTTTVGAPTVELRMSGPRHARVGDEVHFEMVVTNRGGATATGLLIKDHFDEGLKHAVASSPIERDLADLAPGQSHRIGVTLRAVRSGELCHRVEVIGASGVLATGQACVSVTQAAVQPPPGGRAGLSVRKTGPVTGEIGRTAEFTIEVTNTGETTLTDVKVSDMYDASLRPIMATEGYQSTGGALVWTIATLPPRKTERLQVNCRCERDAARACNRVTVTSAQGSRAEDEACLLIRAGAVPPPAGSGLTMRAHALRNPVKVGKSFSYEIRVTNNTSTPDRQVVVVATIPPEMVPKDVGTSGPARHAIEGQTVRFEPVAEVRAGETITYRLRVDALRPGNVKLGVRLTSQNMQQAILAEADSEIFGQ